MPRRRFKDSAYWDGYEEGYEDAEKEARKGKMWWQVKRGEVSQSRNTRTTPPKRKLSAWNKYVKANSKKPRFRYRNGKLNLKKMAVAFRKTPAGRKKKRR